MSGWLSSWSRPRPARVSSPLLACLHIQIGLDRLLQALPNLGPVLYLPGSKLGSWTAARASTRLVAESPLLLPLLHARSLCVVSQVTTSGPLEWLEFEDGHCQCVARMYLLPDSDYLAWDRLIADCAGSATMQQAPLQRWRPASAILTGFQLRHLGGLALLGCNGYQHLSGISLRIAADLAGRERVGLGSVPAHDPLALRATSLALD